MNVIYSRIGIALAVLVGGLALVGSGGCNIGQEGERCNPNLSHDECGAGLACTIPPDCPEAYCCPTSRQSASAYCLRGCNGGQASACAAGGDADCPPEGGADGASE
jgi:hypothetical protein